MFLLNISWVWVRLVSEVKQKLLEKLKKIVRKRESVRKGRRFKRASSRMFSFPKDKYKALEEIQTMLGFTDEELHMFFALLEKATDGYLTFDFGDLKAEFHTCVFDVNTASEISVKVEVEEKEITHSAEYHFRERSPSLEN